MLFHPDIANIKAAAAAEAELLLPPAYPCRDDLANATPTDLVTRADGTRVGGTVSVGDILPGSASPGIWTYYPALTAFAVLTFVAGVVAAYLGAWVPLSAFVDAWGAGGSGMSAFWFAVRASAREWMLWSLAPSIGFVAQMYYWYLVLSEQESSRDFYRVWLLTTVAIVIIAAVIPFFGPLGLAFSSLVAIVAFRLYVGAMEKGRDDIIRDITNDVRAASLMKGRDAQERARKIQAANSLRDKSRLVPLGITNATLRRSGDLLTGDAGSALCVSIADLENTHILCLGQSGCGKTRRFISPFLRWVFAATYDQARGRASWGALVIDGVKNLPRELEDALDVVVSPRTHKLNLIAGLTPERVSAIVLGVYSKGSDDGGWRSKAEVLLRHALTAVRVLSELRDAAGKPAFPEIHYSLASADQWVKLKELRTRSLAIVFSDHGGAFAEPHLQQTYNYWVHEWVEMAEETRSSVLGVYVPWLSALLSREDMQNWCGHESDFDILDLVCARGGRVGIDCPEVVYDIGGRIANALIDASVRNRIMQRVNIGGGSRAAWQAAGENDVLVCVDEAASILNAEFLRWLTASRSLGGHALLALQTSAQIDEALGKELADTLRANCHLRVTFRSDRDTLESACEAAGRRERWFPDDHNVAHAPLLELAKAQAAAGLGDASRNRLLHIAGSMTGVVARRRRLLQTSHRDNGDMDASNPLRAQGTMSGVVRPTTTIEPDELAVELEVPGMALVSYPRAGVMRRGVCYIAADYELTSGPGSTRDSRARRAIEHKPGESMPFAAVVDARVKEVVAATPS